MSEEKEEFRIKEELQITHCGEEYIERTSTVIISDVCRADGPTSSSDMREEQNVETSENLVCDKWLEVEIKQELKYNTSPFGLQDHGATNDPLSSPMLPSPMPGAMSTFHTVAPGYTDDAGAEAIPVFHPITVDALPVAPGFAVDTSADVIPAFHTVAVNAPPVSPGFADNAGADAIPAFHTVVVNAHPVTPGYADAAVEETCADPLALESGCTTGSFPSSVICSTSQSSSVQGHKCTVCNAVFENPNHLIDHMKNHLSIEIKEHEQSDMEEASLDKNQLLYRAKKPYACNKCYMRFSENDALFKHKTSHGPKISYNCKMCEARFSQESYLDSHQKSHHHQGIQCNVCNVKFTVISELLKHKRRFHQEEKPLSCDMCEAKFRFFRQLFAHKKSHLADPYAWKRART